jgi:hypothetical protein
MRIKVYYEDLNIFPNLGKALEQGRYKVITVCKSFIEVEWKEASNGVGGTRTLNTMYLNPYRQAEYYTEHGYFFYC